jgi:NADH-quinone oxidoreductase subunit B
MFLPGCPPRPEMLLDAILKLHMKIQNGPIDGKVSVSQRGDENAPYLKPIDRDTQLSKGLPLVGLTRGNPHIGSGSQ